MGSKKGKLLIVMIIVISLIVVTIQSIPKEPDKELSIIEADHSFDVDSNYFPNTEKMTSIYLYENKLVFMLEDLNIVAVDFFVESPTEYCEVYAGSMYYYCDFDWTSEKVTLTDIFGEVYGTYKFDLGKVSEEAIVFPFGIKYRYFVSNDRKRFYLLLDAQDFTIQFQKRIKFKGLDTTLNGEADTIYYVPLIPANKDFELKENAVAIFEVDSDEDGKSDIKFFVSPKTGFLIEPNNKYKWPVAFWASPKWRGFGLEKPKEDFSIVAKKAPNGTAVIVENYRMIIRMPETEN
ncbi:MAG: hypothetical protein N3F05_04760 [Candidatus Diapherotrites archaeon]|nr:hypothetical protein [Candidatus Diapherotrites archaeon]